MEKIIFESSVASIETVNLEKEVYKDYMRKTAPSNPPRYIADPDWKQEIEGDDFNHLAINLFKGKSIQFSGGSVEIPTDADVTSHLWGLDFTRFPNNYGMLGIAYHDNGIEYKISFSGDSISAHSFSINVVFGLEQVNQQLYLTLIADAPWVQHKSWSAGVLLAIKSKIHAIWPSIQQPVFKFPLGVYIPAGKRMSDHAFRIEGGGFDEAMNVILPTTVVMEVKFEGNLEV